MGSGMIRLVWKFFAAERRGVQVRERHRHAGDWIDDIDNGDDVAGFVLPGLEVADFGSANAQQNPQNFDVMCPLRELRIEAAAPLLDPGEMESSGVGDA